MPSEHALARRMGVSRSTVHLALKELEVEGLLKPAGRRGRMVTEGASGRGLMSRTVVILTDAPGEGLDLSDRTEGWEVFVHVGVMRSIGQVRLHALTIQPSSMKAGDAARLIAERPYGIIALYDVMRRESVEFLRTFKDAGIPVVVYGDERGSSEFDRVVSDHEAGSYQLTRWLIGRGCRRILRLWELGWSDYYDRPAWLGARDAGHVRAMDEAHLEILPALVVPSLSTCQGGREKFEQASRMYAGYLLEPFRRWPDIDAIMCASDGGVFPVATACRILGRRPNEDVALVGYDDYWKECSERQWEGAFPLATVSKQNLRIGQELVELLLARIEGRLGEQPERRLVEPLLKVTGDPIGGRP